MHTKPVHPPAPVAKKIAKERHLHGVCRVDFYDWLRDDSRMDPAVLAYLAAENAYTNAMLAPTGELQQLYQEMLARLPDTQVSVPLLRLHYQYWQVQQKAQQYPQFWRAALATDAQPTLIVDVNQRAQSSDYYQLAALVYSEDEQYVCLAEDTRGDMVYDIRVLRLTDGCWLADTLTDTSGEIVWGNDNRHFYYVKVMPGTLQRSAVYRHQLGTAQQQDTQIYEEQDPGFYTAIRKSADKSLLYIVHYHTETQAVSTLDITQADSVVCHLLPRIAGLRYQVERHGGDFYILTNWQAKNFQLMKVAMAEAAEPACWQTVVAATADGLLEDMQLFDQHLVYVRRERGLPVYRIKPLVDGTERRLAFHDQAFSAYFKDNVSMASPRVRLAYDSLTMPDAVIEFDLVTGQPFVLQQAQILGGFSAADYQSAHLELRARDGAQVPVTLVYRKDKFVQGQNPLYLEGYGAYGLNIDAHFRPEQLCLLDRGFICAFAHVRGSSMLGSHWYEQGKLLHKHNTFYDFIDVTTGLLAQGYGASDQVFAVGESAGGLLIGAVINQAPELYKACIAHVPFVDVVTTMLDDSLPLTCGEYDEWGDPRDKAAFDYMLSYSPYDQISAQHYPHLLVTTGLYDGQVQYFEAAKWVAKLREYKTDNHQLLLRTDFSAGHGGAAGTLARYRQIAQEYAFLLALPD